MNYRHAYHAGNFSDVFKQLILLSVIEKLTLKDSPLCYLESHAGRGVYNLESPEAEKTLEYQTGILKLSQLNNPPHFIQSYLEKILSFNPDHTFRLFPGSCLFAQKYLRDIDKLILAELHIEEHQALKSLFKKNKSVAVHLMDGYKALNAFLPPVEKRGLVFIDPPYESSDEIQTLARALQKSVKKWPEGCYAIWYPIKDDKIAKSLEHTIDKLPLKSKLNLTLTVLPTDHALRLNGCGMMILNPPWKLKESIETWLPWLEKNMRGSH